MGGCNSMCVPMKSPDACRENHARMPKIRHSKRNMSATFNIQDFEAGGGDRLNINTATEEELMTLPSINRVTAHNIIVYRAQIGTFKTVEDLALVTGVGATKMSMLKPEICAKTRGSKSNSPTSSVTHHSIVRQSSKTSSHQVRRININAANVFQLLKVKGVGLITAQHIVTYREKKGPYKSVDDLLKVKGIGTAILSLIRQQVSITEEDQTSNSDSGIVKTHSQLKGDSVSYSSDHMSQLVQMCGPLTQNSTRAHIEPFAFETNNKQVVRIASWNIQQLTEEKVNNPGVKDVICMTILENGFGVIAFQELAKTEVLQTICDELNEPTLPSVSKWKGSRGHWKCITSKAAGRMFQSMEYNGFLYDSQQNVELNSSSLLGKGEEKSFVRRPFLAHFKIHNLDLVLVSVHLKATGLCNEDLQAVKDEVSTVSHLADAVTNHLDGERDVVVMGDFNLSPSNTEFDALRSLDYRNSIPEEMNTNISTKNLQGSQSYDNIWVSSQLQRVCTGNYGVVRTGLTSPWIPDGWSWGGVVSDHCPVWMECYTGDDLDPEAITCDVSGITLTNEP